MMKPTYPTHTTPPINLRRNGFSLIELMVAVVIGLFIILGLTQSFLSMYSNSRSQDTLFQYQNNQRVAITALTNAVQMAGYYAENPTSLTFAQSVFPAYTNADGSQFVASSGMYIVEPFGASAPKTSDTLNIYYESSGVDNAYNCQGGLGPVTSPVTYTKFINSFYVNASNQLVCTVVTNAVAKSLTTLVLANNVQSMNIMYAVDTVNSGKTNSTTNTYLSAANMTAALFTEVRAVQITLNFCAPNLMQPQLNPSATYCPTVVPWVQTINLMGKS